MYRYLTLLVYLYNLYPAINPLMVAFTPNACTASTHYMSTCILRCQGYKRVVKIIQSLPCLIHGHVASRHNTVRGRRDSMRILVLFLCTINVQAAHSRACVWIIISIKHLFHTISIT